MNLIELGYTLDVAQCMVHSAINRKESRGSHQRLDGPNGAYKQRDDVNFLKHSLAFKTEGDEPRIEYSDVKITTFQPAKRVYGAEAEAAEAARKKAQEAK
jgi:fumarate reductase flavoprotein subunit